MNGKRRCFLAAAASSLSVCLSFLLFFSPVFETNDDAAIMDIINGTRGVYDIHMILHHYLGIVLRALYRLTTRIAWYTAAEYFFMCCAFTAIVYVFLLRGRKGIGIAVSVILIVFFATQCYGSIQFTKVAGLLTTGGIFLLFHAVSQEKGGPSEIAEAVCGFALALVGSMYRFDAFLSSAALMTGLGVIFLFDLKKRSKGKRLPAFLRTAGLFLALAGAAFLLRFIDQSFYRSDERWSYYKEYNELRAQLQDYGFPDYDKYRAAYEALGINEDAFDLYSGWNQFDPDKFDIEVMRSLLALKETKAVDGALVRDYFRTVLPFLADNRMFTCYALVLALMLFAVWKSGRIRDGGLWAGFAWCAMLFLLIYFYLFYKGRYTLDRVGVGYWLAMILTAGWIAAECSPQMRFQLQKGELLLLTGLLAGFGAGYWTDLLPAYRRELTRTRAFWRRELLELSEDKEHLYLRKVSMIPVDQCYGPFDEQPFGILSNQGTLGGWICSIPTQLDILAHYDVSNPYRDLIDNDRVYLVDNEIERTMRYLREYYNPDAIALLEKKVQGGAVYRIVTDAEKSQDGFVWTEVDEGEKDSGKEKKR